MGGGDVCPAWVAAGWVEAYQRVLGEELRKLRVRRGWTRRRLHEELGLVVALATLTTYELGTRQVASVRLAQICLALGEDIGELLARVHGRLGAVTEAACWVVDLVEAAGCDEPRLRPLRGWARARLAAGRLSTVQVGSPGLRALAVLCDVDERELARLLPQRPRDHCEPATVNVPLSRLCASDNGG